MAIHSVDKQFCQLILTKPTVENVTTVGQYQLTQPRLKGINLLHQSELPILYGGGRDFLFGELKLADGSEQQLVLSDLFVLNTCVLIWMKDWERSLQVPYRNIVYHAVRKIEEADVSGGHRLELMISVERDPIINELFPVSNVGYSRTTASNDSSFNEIHDQDSTGPQSSIATVELVLRPKYANFDRHYNEDVEDLFTFKEFGLNRGDTMVRNSHAAILACLELYPDEEPSGKSYSIQDQGAMSGIPDIAHIRNEYVNSGTADDLDGDSTMELYAQDGQEASMALQFYTDTPLAGKRNRS